MWECCLVFGHSMYYLVLRRKEHKTGGGGGGSDTRKECVAIGCDWLRLAVRLCTQLRAWVIFHAEVAPISGLQFATHPSHWLLVMSLSTILFVANP